MSLPHIESASFAISQLEPTQPTSRSLHSSNPFGALAEQIVPAGVLFICIGVAMIAIPNKEQIISQMQIFNKG